MLLMPTCENAHDVSKKLQSGGLVRQAFVLQEQIGQRILPGFQLDLEQEIGMVLSEELVHIRPRQHLR